MYGSLMRQLKALLVPARIKAGPVNVYMDCDTRVDIEPRGNECLKMSVKCGILGTDIVFILTHDDAFAMSDKIREAVQAYGQEDRL